MADMTTGQFLSSLRKTKGFTQQNVADALNVSNKTVSGWERDVALPDANILPMLAELYEVSCDELLCGRFKDGDPSCALRDDIQLRLFISTYETQKTMICAIYTVIAALFLFGAYYFDTFAADDYKFAFALPLCAVSLAVSLIGYFMIDFPLRRHGSKFMNLRRKIMTVTRISVLAEAACPIVLLPVLFTSENILTKALVYTGFILLCILVLIAVDNVIKYCNKDLYPDVKSSRKRLVASVATVAIAICCLTPALVCIHKFMPVSQDVTETQYSFDNYDSLIKALTYDPLETGATGKSYAPSDYGNAISEGKVEFVYTYPKSENISASPRLHENYTDFTVIRRDDCDELHIMYRTVRIYSDDPVSVGQTVVTSPYYAMATHVDYENGKYVIHAPGNIAAISEKYYAKTDRVSSFVLCGAGATFLAVYVTIALTWGKRTKDNKENVPGKTQA